nr:MAG: hypothetical protein [Bacteriophage sp.]
MEVIVGYSVCLVLGAGGKLVVSSTLFILFSIEMTNIVSPTLKSKIMVCAKKKKMAEGGKVSEKKKPQLKCGGKVKKKK